MSPRTIVVLLVVLGVLVGVALFQSGREDHVAKAGLGSGDLLLPGMDVNAITALEVATSASTTLVERKEGRWIVPSLYSYPADFQKVADVIRGLSELQAGQVFEKGNQYLEEFGLGNDHSSVSVLLRSEPGETMRLALGKVKQGQGQGRMSGYAVGRYIQVDGGPVVLADDALSGLHADADEWVDRELLNVSSRDIEGVTVEISNTVYTVDVENAGRYEVSGLREDEEIDSSKASRLVNALQYLRCDTVADPGLSDEEMGFDSAGRYVARTKEGLEYMALIGAGVPGDTGYRYLRLDIALKPSPAPTREEVSSMLPIVEGGQLAGEEKGEVEDREARIDAELEKRLAAYEVEKAAQREVAARLKGKLSGWTYVVSSYVADSLSVPRGELIRAKQNAEADMAETSTDS